MKRGASFVLLTLLVAACTAAYKEDARLRSSQILEDLRQFTLDLEDDPSDDGSAMEGYVDKNEDEEETEDENEGKIETEYENEGEDQDKGRDVESFQESRQTHHRSRRDGEPDYKLMTFDELLKREAGTIVESNFGELVCTFQAKFSDCEADFLPVQGLCPELPSLSSFMSRFFRDIQLLKVTSNVLHPDKFDIEKFTIDRCEGKSLTFQLIADESMNGIERFLVINNAKLKVRMPYNDPKLTLASFGISGTASTSYDGEGTVVKISKKENTTMLEFVVDKLAKISLATIAKKFHFKIEDMLEDDMGPVKTVLNLDKFALTEASIHGYLSQGEAFEFLISGKPTDNALFQDATTTYIVVQKYKSETKLPKAAIYSVYDKPLLGMLRALSVDPELPEISLYSDIKKFSFTVASDEFQFINMNPAKKLSMEFTSARFMIPAVNSGLELRFKIPNPQKVLKRQYGSPQADNGNNLVTVNITDKALKFNFPDEVAGPVPALIDVIWKNPSLKVENLPLPDDILARLVSLRVSVERPLYVNVTFMITSPYVVAPGLLSLNGMYIKISSFGVSPTEFTHWRLYSANQRTSINGTMDVDILEDDGSYCVQGVLPADVLTDVEEKTGAQMLLDEKRKLFNQTLGSPVKDVRFESPLSKEKADFIRILGTVILVEGKEVAMDGVFAVSDSRMLSIGLEFKQHCLDGILELLIGKRMLKACWLKFSEAGIIFSGSDFKQARLKSPLLSQKKIKSGARFVGNLATTTDSCQEDKLCLFIHRFVTKEIISTMEGTISPRKGFDFKATISQSLVFSDTVSMTKNELVVSGMDELSSYVALVGQLSMTELEINIQASISMKDKGRLLIQGEPVVELVQPLGFPAGKLLNLKLMQDVEETKPASYLRFEGLFRYGVKEETKLEGKTYLQYDLTDDKYHYFLGSFDRLSMEEYAAASDIKLKHGILLGLKFNATAMFSYTSSKEKFRVQERGSRMIPQVFMVDGKAEVLGNYTACDIMDKGYGFRLKCVFPDITFDDGAIIARQGGRGSGPRFLAKVHKDRSKVSVKGTFSALGITALNDLAFHSDGTAELVMQGKLNDVLEGSYRLTTQYGRIDRMHFMMESAVSEVAMRQTVEGFHEHIKGLSKLMEDVKGTMQVKRNEARASYEHVGFENEKIKQLLSGIENNIYKKGLVLEKQKSSIRRNCVSDCGSACYQGVTWNPKCTKVKGRYQGCTGWSGCSSNVADTPCIALCEAQKIATSVSAYEEHAQIRGLIEDYHDGKVKLDQTEKLLQEARRIKNHLQETQNMLDLVENVINKAKNVTGHGDGQDHSIYIEEMTISGPLSANKDKLYPLQMKVRMGGNRVSIVKRVPVESDFFTKMGELIAAEVVPELKLLNEDLEAITAKHGVLDSMVAKFIKIAKEKTEEEKLSEVEAEGRDYIASAKEQEFYQVVMDPIPHYISRGEETTVAFRENAPWVISSRHQVEADPSPGSYEKVNDTRSTGDPCGEFSDVVDNYEDIMKGVNDVMDSHESGMEGFQARRDAMISQSDTLKHKVLDLGKGVDANDAELQDMSYWANKVEEGAKKWIQSNKRHLEEQDEEGLDLFATQLDRAIQQLGDMNLDEHLHSLKKRGVQAIQQAARFRRSALPESSLHEVHEGISDMLKRKRTLRSAKERLPTLQHHVTVMRRMAEQCR